MCPYVYPTGRLTQMMPSPFQSLRCWWEEQRVNLPLDQALISLSPFWHMYTRPTLFVSFRTLEQTVL